NPDRKLDLTIAPRRGSNEFPAFVLACPGHYDAPLWCATMPATEALKTHVRAGLVTLGTCTEFAVWPAACFAAAGDSAPVAVPPAGAEIAHLDCCTPGARRFVRQRRGGAVHLETVIKPTRNHSSANNR